MKKIITICAECKGVLETTAGVEGVQAFATAGAQAEILYSHGICHECAVRIYSKELIEKVFAKINKSYERKGGLTC